MLIQHFKGEWETAIIYENSTNGKELVKFKNGAEWVKREVLDIDNKEAVSKS